MDGIPAGNLPAPTTPLVGREEELARIGELLDGGARLVSLTGTGGVGKTRLAIELARAQAGDGGREVVFVPLASLNAPVDLAPATLSALGAPASTTDSDEEELRVQMGRRPRLLILDNTEHLTGSGDGIEAQVGRWLSWSEGVSIVTTGRGALGISAERVVPIEPLPVTGSDGGEGPAHELFVSRLSARGVVVRAEDGMAIQEICRRLDGLPLALELAAARGRALTPSAMLERLEDRFAFLVRGPGDLPERQRTLAAAIEWSWQLLTADEQEAAARLAIFQDGWTLEGAEALIEDADPLAILEQLVEKSLVVAVGGGEGEPRYMMLESVKAFGRKQLEALGVEDEARRAYVEHVCEIARRCAIALRGQEADVAHGRLVAELNNLRDVMRRGAATGAHCEQLMGAAIALSWYFLKIGRWSEGYRLTAGLLRGCDREGIDPALWARCEAAAGRLSSTYTQGKPHFEVADRIARRLGDADTIAEVLLFRLQREAVWVTPDVATIAKEALDVFRRRDDPWELAVVLSYAPAHLEGIDQETRREMFAEALHLFEQAGDTFALSMPMINLGEIEREAGNWAEARDLNRRAIEIRLRPPFIPSNRVGLIANINLSHICLRLGDLDGTLEALGAMDADQEVLDEAPEEVACMVMVTGFALVATGEAERGVRLMSRGNLMRTAYESQLDQADQSDLEWATDMGQAALGEAAFAAAWEAGLALSNGAAVEEARQARRELGARLGQEARGDGPPLTGREIEVLRLLSDGLGNKQIAGVLGISTRTAESHVANIYAKLGAAGRVEAVRMAIELGVAKPSDSSP